MNAGMRGADKVRLTSVVTIAAVSSSFAVGAGPDMTFRCPGADLSKGAGDSGALRRNGYLRPVPLKAGKPELRKQTQKSPSPFGESDGPMTELWCEGSSKRMRWDRARPHR